MMKLLDSPRVRELLNEAEQALAMLDSRTDARADVKEALDSIYRDLGKFVHGLARQDKSARVEKTLASALSIPEPLDAGQPLTPPRRGWYTDEVDLGGRPLFTEGDLDDETDIPEPDAMLRIEPEVSDEQPRVVRRLHALETDAEQGALHELRAVDLPVWSPLLVAFLELLVLPDDLLDSAAMPEEASKVQWASGELNGRLPELPESIQVSVLGMLAARARNLQAHVDLDIGPRMALDRLKRYREVNELPWVVGLLPGARPERDTWAEDATVFWNLLNPGAPR